MADFHFLRPLWFIALIALPLIIWLIKKLSFQYSGWQQVIPAHLQKVLMSQGNKKQSVSIFVPSLIFVLAVTALAGPTYQKLPQPVFNVERGSVIVMDMSYSMYSTDVAPNRLTRSRFKAIDILDSINEGDIGLVAYAGASFIISPLTQDINNIKLLLPSLTPEIMPEIGSDPFPALLTANDMLINAGHLKGDIYWLTDDVDRLDIEAINEFIQDYPHRLNILGIGTSDGAPITLPNGELLKDDTGQIVIPKLPIGKLNGLAKKSGGVYQTITHSHDDVESLTSYQLPQDSKELEQEQTKLGDSWQELGPYIVLAILPFVLGYFRRGIILSILPVVMFLSPTPTAFAQAIDKPQTQAVPTNAQPDNQLVQAWNNLWQTPDQQAQKKYNEQKFEAAAQQFEDKLWQSSAQYRSGNYQQAAEILSGIDTPQALYNKGNALAKAGQIDEAIEAYQQALDQQPDFTQAQDNKALLEKLKEQNQQQDQQGKDQDQQKESEQNENQNNDQQGEQNGANDQENQNSESQEQQSDAENQQDQSQNNKQENQNQQDNAEQDQKQSDQQQQNEQNKEQEQQAQNQNQQKTEGEEQQQEMKQAAMQESDQKQKELEQKHMQLLNKVTDDPHLLLRNKMQLEYQKRRHQNSGAKKKW